MGLEEKTDGISPGTLDWTAKEGLGGGGGLPTSRWGLELDASLTYGASQSFSYRESFLFIHNHGILQGVFDRELSKTS